MSDHPKRTTSGRFAKGQSGNPAGAAARKPKPIMSSIDAHMTILEVAGSETLIKTDERVEGVSMLKRNVLALASGKGNRPAARDFIELTISAAYAVERHRKREEDLAASEARREAQR